jgi:RNA-binding protein
VAPTLTTKERADLKARAHSLEPVVQTGNAGLTDRLVAEVDRALTAHELIKVKIGGDDRAERIALGDELAASTDAAVVHRVGKIVMLWRPNPVLGTR